MLICSDWAPAREGFCSFFRVRVAAWLGGCWRGLGHFRIHFLRKAWPMMRFSRICFIAAGGCIHNVIKVQSQIKAPLNTGTGARKACLKLAQNTLGKLPDTPAGTSPCGGRRPPPGEVLDSASWILSERVSSGFEARFSGSCACIERCFYPHLYFIIPAARPPCKSDSQPTMCISSS